MFGSLRKKLGDAIGKFSKKVEDESEEIEEEEEEEKEEKEEIEKEKTEVQEEQEKQPTEDEQQTPLEKKEPEQKKKDIHKKKKLPEKNQKTFEEKKKKKEKKGIFGKISDKITKIQLSPDKFDEIFWDLEVVLMENNVSIEVIDKIKNDMKQEIVKKKISRRNLQKHIEGSLKDSIEDLFEVKTIDIINKAKEKKPFVIAFIGVNGSGKTTTLAKMAETLKKNGFKVVAGACDTFRAAAIHQLEQHTNKLGIKLIKHDYGADPAAVGYDAVCHAKAKNLDVVLLDTAGRLHSNKNLMEELKKLIRITKPDLNIFVGESIAGNDLVEQVKFFNEQVKIDGIILAKADIDSKGGAAISVSYITNKPILYIGTGQSYDDLEEFDKDTILENIGLG
ncbi:signal recognition particle-docking protein FtsY [Candidatus Woesearchaeota archaeon]|nr:signal recognition particle-docking protein FtsY [Candidatus Woesearchaeota archaeon]